HIPGPRHGAHDARNLVRHPIQLVKIGTEDVDRHERGLARERLAEPVREKCQYLGLQVRIVRDHIAYGRLRLLLGAPRHALELDVELAAVRFPRVLTRFGTTDGLLDGEDSRDGEQVARQPRAGRLHRLERSAACGSVRVSNSSAAAGVTVNATTSDASVARLNDAASGPKKLPCNPDSISIGASTRTTTNVA